MDSERLIESAFHILASQGRKPAPADLKVLRNAYPYLAHVPVPDLARLVLPGLLRHRREAFARSCPSRMEESAEIGAGGRSGVSIMHLIRAIRVLRDRKSKIDYVIAQLEQLQKPGSS